MTRQLELEEEVRSTQRRDALYKALDYGFVGALESQGVELLGFSFVFDAYSSRLTIKGVVAGKYSICFVYADSPINCILRAQGEAMRDALKWGLDKYHPSNT